MKHRLLLVLIPLVTISCSSTLVIIEKEYEKKRIEQASMTVVVRNDPPNIDYSGNVEPEFGPGDQDALIFDYFKKAIVDKIPKKTCLNPVLFEDYSVNPVAMRDEKSFQVPDGTNFNIRTPAQGTVFQFGKAIMDYVLLIDNLSIGTSMQTNTYWVHNWQHEPVLGCSDVPAGIKSYLYFPSNGLILNQTMSFTPPSFTPPPRIPQMHSNTVKNLTCTANILIWDNRAKALVAYGHVETKIGSNFFPVITMSTWESLTDGFIAAIFSKTPFNRTSTSSLY